MRRGQRTQPWGAPVLTVSAGCGALPGGRWGHGELGALLAEDVLEPAES